jgi:hypothetical protein
MCDQKEKRNNHVWPRSLIEVSDLLFSNYHGKKNFRNRYYTSPGHAHEITYPVYRRKNLFGNPSSWLFGLCPSSQATASGRGG